MAGEKHIMLTYFTFIFSDKYQEDPNFIPVFELIETPPLSDYIPHGLGLPQTLNTCLSPLSNEIDAADTIRTDSIIFLSLNLSASQHLHSPDLLFFL